MNPFRRPDPSDPEQQANRTQPIAARPSAPPPRRSGLWRGMAIGGIAGVAVAIAVPALANTAKPVSFASAAGTPTSSASAGSTPSASASASATGKESDPGATAPSAGSATCGPAAPDQHQADATGPCPPGGPAGKPAGKPDAAKGAAGPAACPAPGAKGDRPPPPAPPSGAPSAPAPTESSTAPSGS